VAVVGFPPLAGLFAACGGRERGGTMMDRQAPQWMMSGGMDAQMTRDMPVIHDLLVNHEQIERHIEDVPGGIRAITTSSDPQIPALIRDHVWG
jgi:hypothetical protein